MDFFPSALSIDQSSLVSALTQPKKSNFTIQQFNVWNAKPRLSEFTNSKFVDDLCWINEFIS